jgi:ubiquitin
LLTFDPDLYQEIDEALMSKMSSEEEEAVQAEFALLEKEARGEVSRQARSRIVSNC